MRTDPSTVTRRSTAVDILRGAALLLMALDHVRVYSGIPAGGAVPAIFWTRWVTHFCAPGFLFLAGTSLYLSTRGARPTVELSKQLVVRGLWLVVLELTVIRLAWTFNFGHPDNLLAGVIWAIGWSMVLMAAIVHLPRWAIATFGLAMIAGHNLIGMFFVQNNPWQNPYPWPFRVAYAGGWFSIGSQGPDLVVLYSIVPWVGVMAAGYAFGWVLGLEPRRRDRLCYAIGLSAVGLFVLLRLTGVYGDRLGWPDASGRMPGWLAFFRTTKYPASLHFLLMTLGPTIALIPLLERLRGRVARMIGLFGRVPLFFYLIHIPLIHLTAVVIALFRTPESVGWLFEDHPVLKPPVPEGYTYGIGLLYLVWVLVCVGLYFPCRWYADVRPSLPKWLRNLI